MISNLEETYHRGATLDLYAWQQPTLPTKIQYVYENPLPTPTQLGERYNQSIAERVALPPTPPAVSITLEKRLESNMYRVSHVWTARVRGSSSHLGATTTTTGTTYPPQLVAKIYDPAFFDDEESQSFDPFVLRDFGVSCEVEAYRRLGPLQGTKVPQFYGYFTAALPEQHDRSVFIILFEEVPGRELRVIVPPGAARNVCVKHKGAIIDAALRLSFDIIACGVMQRNMHPRHVVLRPQTHVSLSASGTRFCDTKECLLTRDIDCDELNMVMVDFEMVDFKEPNASFGEPAVQGQNIKKVKSRYLESWLEG